MKKVFKAIVEESMTTSLLGMPKSEEKITPEKQISCNKEHKNRINVFIMSLIQY